VLNAKPIPLNGLASYAALTRLQHFDGKSELRLAGLAETHLKRRQALAAA